MSEWYDNHKQQITNDIGLQHQQVDKTNPRRKLTAEETKRLIKLEAIAVKLKNGENVQNHQLQTWVSEDKYAHFEAEW